MNEYEKYLIKASIKCLAFLFVGIFIYLTTNRTDLIYVKNQGFIAGMSIMWSVFEIPKRKEEYEASK